MKPIEQTHPSLKKIEYFKKTNDKQLFSYRNNIREVYPADVVHNYLRMHTIDKQVIREAIEKCLECYEGCDSEDPCLLCRFKKELGL